MIIIGTVNGSSIDKVLRRIIKVVTFGSVAVNNAIECSPYGVDSNPVKNSKAIVIESTENGKKVVVGYVNMDQKADKGEIRIYATNDNREEQNYFWIKNDGTIEIGGDSDNMVRYSSLNSGLSNQDTQIQAELVKIAAGISSAGGAYTPGTISTNISGAKIDEVKTS